MATCTLNNAARKFVAWHDCPRTRARLAWIPFGVAVLCALSFAYWLHLEDTRQTVRHRLNAVLARAIDESEMAILTIGPDRRVLLCGEAASQLLGTNPAGMDFANLCSPATQTDFETVFSQLASEGNSSLVVRMDVELRTSSEHYQLVHMTMRRLHDPQQVVVATLLPAYRAAAVRLSTAVNSSTPHDLQPSAAKPR